jgi:hypothetical protein
MSPNRGTSIVAPLRKRGMISLSSLVLLVVSNGISFFLGAFIALNAGLVSCGSARTTSTSNSQHQGASVSLRNLQKEPCQEAKCPICASSSDLPLLPETVQNFAAGMAHVNKEAFTSKFDLGVPLDLPKPGIEDVLVIYNRDKAMPNKLQQRGSMSSIELVTADEAVENCDYMNVVLTSHDQGRTQCLVIVPQVSNVESTTRSESGKHFWSFL